MANQQTGGLDGVAGIVSQQSHCLSAMMLRQKRRLALLALALALVAVMWARPDTARAETVEEYRRVLVETLVALDSAKSAPGFTSLTDSPWVAMPLRRLESIESVTTDAGEMVAIDNRQLIQRLRGSREEGRAAIESVRQLVDALDVAAARAEWGSEPDARRRLNEVLAQPDFRAAGPNPAKKLLDDLRQRIASWLEGAFPNSGVPAWLRDPLGALVAIVMLLVLVGGTIFAFIFYGFSWRSTRQNIARYAVLRASKAGDPEDADGARAAAERAAEAGDFRHAVHYLFLWALLHLAAKSRLRYDRTLTNREQLRALREGGEIGELLTTAVNAFDRLWYGHVLCTSEEYRQFRRTIERIVEVAA